jgi:hypothetical protein
MANVTTHDASIELYPFALALSRSSLSVAVCCTELIDNSLDSEAGRVLVDISQGKHIHVRDTGKGIERLGALVRFGGHVPNRKRSTAGSGFYGIGFKDAALRLGGIKSVVEIKTSRDGVCRRGRIEWAHLERSNTCMTETSVEAPDATAGTEIRIAPLRMRFPEGKDREVLIRQLAYTYSPAIKRGAHIEVRAAGVTYDLAKHRWCMPELVEHINDGIELGGKRARLYAGIVKDGVVNTKPGITYMHGYRVIKGASSEGCGNHSVQRICGFVEIERGWDRTKNKDELVDAEDLYDEVERRLEPLLKKADTKAHTIEIAGGLAGLEADLLEALGEPTGKAKRGPKRGPEVLPGVIPKNSGVKHGQADHVQPSGDVKPKKTARGLKVEIVEGAYDGGEYGRYERGAKSHRITLFKEHPWISRSMVPFDHDRLFLCAMTLLVIGPTAGGSGQTEMPFLSPADFARKLGQATARAGVKFDGVALDRAAE